MERERRPIALRGENEQISGCQATTITQRDVYKRRLVSETNAMQVIERSTSPKHAGKHQPHTAQG